MRLQRSTKAAEGPQRVRETSAETSFSRSVQCEPPFGHAQQGAPEFEPCFKRLGAGEERRRFGDGRNRNIAEFARDHFNSRSPAPTAGFHDMDFHASRETPKVKVCCRHSTARKRRGQIP